MKYGKPGYCRTQKNIPIRKIGLFEMGWKVKRKT